MKLHLDSSKGYYSSRVGLNMFPLTTGEYKVVFELYFPSVSINRSTVQIPAISNTEAVFTLGARALVPGHRHKMVLCSDTRYPV